MILSELMQSWESAGAGWDQPTLLKATRQAIALSDNRLAIDIAQSAIKRFGDNPNQLYCLALAYANSGAREEVFTHLEHLIEITAPEHERYTDALCLMGRVEKERYFHSPDSSPGALSNALDAYHSAWTQSGSSFAGINAATLSLLAGDLDLTREITTELIDSGATDQEAFWRFATLAEAHLVSEQFDQATKLYEQVIQSCGTNYGQLASVRRHIPHIEKVINVPEQIQKLLQGPTICVFTGHRFDSSDQDSPRFPERLRDAVAAAIGEHIEAHNIQIGYASAACGSDLIFAQEMLNRGRELHLVLPFEAEKFCETSVKLKGVDQSTEFWAVLEQASSVHVASDKAEPIQPGLYSQAAKLTEEFAERKARESGGAVYFLAAIDPYDTGREGGTMERSMIWLEKGYDLHIVDIAMLREPPS